LTGMVVSYEAIANLVENRRLPDALREGRKWWDKRTEKFLRFLHDERVFLSHVAREGQKLLATEEHPQLLHLEERVDTLARRVWSAARYQGEETTSVPRARVGTGSRDL